MMTEEEIKRSRKSFLKEGLAFKRRKLRISYKTNHTWDRQPPLYVSPKHAKS